MICFNLRAILIGGFVVMGFLEILTGVFAMKEMNNPSLYCLLISLFVYQICLGPYTWVYIAEIGNAKSVAMGSIFIWGVVQEFTIQYLFDYMGNDGVFWLFGGLSFLTGIIFCIFMKETKGLTQEQTKVLYVPEHLLKV